MSIFGDVHDLQDQYVNGEVFSFRHHLLSSIYDKKQTRSPCCCAIASHSLQRLYSYYCLNWMFIANNTAHNFRIEIYVESMDYVYYGIEKPWNIFWWFFYWIQRWMKVITSFLWLETSNNIFITYNNCPHKTIKALLLNDIHIFYCLFITAILLHAFHCTHNPGYISNLLDVAIRKARIYLWCML